MVRSVEGEAAIWKRNNCFFGWVTGRTEKWGVTGGLPLIGPCYFQDFWVEAGVLFNHFQDREEVPLPLSLITRRTRVGRVTEGSADTDQA